MNFKLKLVQIWAVVLSSVLVSISGARAAEWKVEPSLYARGQYNDNVSSSVDSSNTEGSSAYTLGPRVKFAGDELNLWDVSVDTRGKITRFQSIEDADSENIFFVFDGGRQTELTNWRLNTSFERNSTFDTDFDTKTPDLGLSDRTERTSKSISPSVSWSMSETSQISLSFNTTEVSYDEVTSLNYRNYENDSLNLSANWQYAANHSIGFTSSYNEYESPDAGFFYDQSVLQLDYKYTINELSNISLSVGSRSLDSLRLNGQIVACENPGEFEATGQCLFSNPILGDLENKEEGVVVNLVYGMQSETELHDFIVSRSVTPSSFGGAQETRSATYRLNIKNTERFSTNLVLAVTEIETIVGVDSSSDRLRYRIEPSIAYKLNKNWKLNASYSLVNQNISNSNEDSVSNIFYVSLLLHWPKLITTY